MSLTLISALNGAIIGNIAPNTQSRPIIRDEASKSILHGIFDVYAKYRDEYKKQASQRDGKMESIMPFRKYLLHALEHGKIPENDALDASIDSQIIMLTWQGKLVSNEASLEDWMRLAADGMEEDAQMPSEDNAHCVYLYLRDFDASLDTEQAPRNLSQLTSLSPPNPTIYNLTDALNTLKSHFHAYAHQITKKYELMKVMYNAAKETFLATNADTLAEFVERLNKTPIIEPLCTANRKFLSDYFSKEDLSLKWVDVMRQIVEQSDAKMQDLTDNRFNSLNLEAFESQIAACIKDLLSATLDSNTLQQHQKLMSTTIMPTCRDIGSTLTSMNAFTTVLNSSTSRLKHCNQTIAFIRDFPTVYELILLETYRRSKRMDFLCDEVRRWVHSMKQHYIDELRQRQFFNELLSTTASFPRTFAPEIMPHFDKPLPSIDVSQFESPFIHLTKEQLRQRLDIPQLLAVFGDNLTEHKLIHQYMEADHAQEVCLVASDSELSRSISDEFMMESIITTDLEQSVSQMLQSKREEMRLQHEAMQAQLEEVSSSLNVLQGKYTDLLEKCSNLNQEDDTHRIEMDALHDQLAASKKKCENLEESLKSTIEESTKKIQAKVDEMEHITAEMDTLCDCLSDARTMIDKLMLEKKDLESQWTLLQATPPHQQAPTADELNCLREEIKALKTQLSDKDETIANLRHNQQPLLSNDSETVLNDLLTENERIKQENQLLYDQLQDQHHIQAELMSRAKALEEQMQNQVLERSELKSLLMTTATMAQKHSSDLLDSHRRENPQYTQVRDMNSFWEEMCRILAEQNGEDYQRVSQLLFARDRH